MFLLLRFTTDLGEQLKFLYNTTIARTYEFMSKLSSDDDKLLPLLRGDKGGAIPSLRLAWDPIFPVDLNDILEL